jgi:hypothetical protein
MGSGRLLSLVVWGAWLVRCSWTDEGTAGLEAGVTFEAGVVFGD